MYESMKVEFEIKSNLSGWKCGKRWMTRKIREKIQKESKVERAQKIGFIRPRDGGRVKILHTATEFRKFR